MLPVEGHSILLRTAFGLRWPVTIAREGNTPAPLLGEGERDRCTRARAFATRPSVTDEQVEARRSRAGNGAGEPAEAPEGASPQEKAPEREAREAVPKRRRSRPKGSKNKKTLEREAAERAKAG